MNVRVVVTGPNNDRILARMARALGTLDGWSVSERPDPDADANYYLPYIELSGKVRPKTPSAAYFTHLEPGTKGKLWARAAADVDLRIVTAPQYHDALAAFGRTVTIPPPVDLAHFTPGKRDANPVPVVGVSGWVYPGGRKGEKLVKAAAESKLGKSLVWKAAGKGWPVPTRMYPWSALPDFYRSLDVYLCAATIEGVPMPPLEAMACGVRCVIPRGVGLLDELPEQYDLFRYEPGNLESMLEALGNATSDAHYVSRKGLRGAVAPYTADAWRAGHEAAFAQLLATDTAAGISAAKEPLIVHTDAGDVGVQRPDLRTDQGIYVVAYGDPARACAVRLLRSVREHMPNTPVMLVGDRALDEGEARFQEAPRGDIGARSVKVQIYDRAPAEWQRVLYLDADTELIAPVPFLFDIVKQWDFAICKNPQRFHAAQHMVRPDNGDECRETFRQWGTDQMMQWNGGVFSFQRNERTAAFFAAWHREWLRYGKRDQAALLRALWQHPLKMYPLGNEWNLVPNYDPISRSAGIVHHVTEAREWGTGIITPRGDSPEAFAAVARNRRNGAAKPGIVSSRSFGRSVNEPRGGPLVKVEIKPGQYIRVMPKEAERLLALQEEKARRQVANKMLQPVGNKSGG